MSRYIDADTVFNELTSRYKTAKGEARKAYREALDIVTAVEDIEVRHGEWVFKFYCGNMSGYDYGMNCSECGKPMYRQLAEKMPSYCPNCGARMVNEDE